MSEAVTHIHCETVEDRRRHCISLVWPVMTTSTDFQGDSHIASFFNCYLLYSCAAGDTISTDLERCVFNL